jgi:hypothetical protein
LFFKILGSSILGALSADRNSVAVEKDPIMFVQSKIRIITTVGRNKDDEHSGDGSQPSQHDKESEESESNKETAPEL